MVLVAIPCHNEAAFLAPVIQQCLPLADEVWVVDDGSTDGTPEVARNAGAQVYARPTNGGYGAAIHSCFVLARERGAAALITLDGDGQHNPAELPDVAAPVLAGHADLVLGSRFMGRPTNVPRYRRFGIDVITGLYNLGHAPISDAQCGFRAYSAAALEVAAPNDPGMGASVEVLIRARNAGLRLSEVPVSCRYHAGGSSQGPVRHGLTVAAKVIEHRLRRGLAALMASPGGRGS